MALNKLIAINQIKWSNLLTVHNLKNGGVIYCGSGVRSVISEHKTSVNHKINSQRIRTPTAINSH